MPYLKLSCDIFSGHSCFQAYNLPSDPWLFVDDCCIILSCDSVAVVPTIFPDIYMVIDDKAKLLVNRSDHINDIASFALSPDDCEIIYGDVLLTRRQGDDFVPLSRDDVVFLIDNFDLPY